MTGNREDHFANQKMYATFIAVIMADVSWHLNYTELNAICSRMHQVCFFCNGRSLVCSPKANFKILSSGWRKYPPWHRLNVKVSLSGFNTCKCELSQIKCKCIINTCLRCIPTRKPRVFVMNALSAAETQSEPIMMVVGMQTEALTPVCPHLHKWL